MGFVFVYLVFYPRPAPLGCVPAVAARRRHSRHRDGPGGQDPYGHLLSDQPALVSTSSLWLPPLSTLLQYSNEVALEEGRKGKEVGLPCGAV